MSNEKKHDKPGRPFGTLKYDNEEDLQNGIDAYFNKQDANGKAYTMTGLALALNIDPKTLSNYGRNDNYFPAINHARMRVLEYKEERLDTKDGVQGAKFDLCNNSERMGGLKYSDKQEYSVTADVQPDSDSLRSQLKDLLSGLTDEEKAALKGE
jgi:hypothetical protein